MLECPWDLTQRTDIGGAVQRIVDAYRLASRTAVPRMRLDPFIERLAVAAAECLAVFPEIDSLLQAAQERHDANQLQPQPRLQPVLPPRPEDSVAAAFAAFGWDGPFWAQSERRLVLISDRPDAVDDRDAQAAAAEQMITSWADFAHAWRTGHVTEP